MFKKRYTKWVALGSFSFTNYDYVTFIRKNLKNGLLQFKTKKVNGWFGVLGCTSNFMPTSLINTQKVWDDVNNSN